MISRHRSALLAWLEPDVSRKKESMMKNYLVPLALAAVLAGCGGGGGGGSSANNTPVFDSFSGYVSTLVASAPEDASPVDIDAVTATAPDETSPAPVM
jgi:hypothetical protein